MDVTGEGLGPVVDHLHRAAGVEGEHAQVDVEVDVLAGPEGATDAGGIRPDLVGTQSEAGDDLLMVGMDELAGGVQVHPALAVGNGQACFGPEGSLVLHAHFVVALDHDLALLGRLGQGTLGPRRRLGARDGAAAGHAHASCGSTIALTHSRRSIAS